MKHKCSWKSISDERRNRKKLESSFVFNMKQINIDSELEQFHSHIELNKRTILSAKFGDGKTYFLEQFKEKYKSEFEFITLHPVNYAASRNEDVFEYIKRDIMLQIADWTEAYDFDVDLNAFFGAAFSWENLKPLVDFAVGCMPQHLKLVAKICEKGKDILDRYNEKLNTLGSYNSAFAAQRGGIYEHDAFTELICNTIDGVHRRVPEASKPAKVMLLIEDLDRIDPGHLFRILNVLGAHIDEDAETNKFGLDNIVLVLDYNVTRKVFQHFYGKEANYEGYMTKFLSHQPFEYSILHSAHNRIYEYLKNECLLNQQVLKQPLAYTQSNTTTLDSIINHLSVRQVAAALDGIEDMVSKDPFDIRNIIVISPVAPVTKFVALIVRLGYTLGLNDIIRALFYNNNNNSLDFFGGYLLSDYNLHCGTFTYRNNKYTAQLSKDENGITTVKYLRCDSALMDIDITHEYLEKCLRIACEKVKDYHSRQVFK